MCILGTVGRTLIHCCSSFVSILSSTIFVCIGTHVKRSKPSHTSPLNSRFVFTFLTKRADSIRTPKSPALSAVGYQAVFDRYLGDALTEARLVGDDMARLERHCTREPVWPLVDIQERAEAVTCSVLHCDG